MIHPPPTSTLFPYTTLFRSVQEQPGRVELGEQPGLLGRVAHPAEKLSGQRGREERPAGPGDRKSTRLNSSHQIISYAVFCLKKKKNIKKVFYDINRLFRVPP